MLFRKHYDFQWKICITYDQKISLILVNLVRLFTRFKIKLVVQQISLYA